MGRRGGKTKNGRAADFTRSTASEEMEFQAIVDKAKDDVATGNSLISTRRSVRITQTIGSKQDFSKLAKGKIPNTTPPRAVQDGQATVVDIADFKIPSNEEREAEVDRDECVWQPNPDQKYAITRTFMEQFVNACRRHMDVGPDLAMRSMYRKKFNLQKALESVEEDFAGLEAQKFTKEEDDALVKGLVRFGKNFSKISKKVVVTRSIGECVARYYYLKKNICFTTNTICPTLLRFTTDDRVAVPRSECDNCRDRLFEKHTKCDFRGRRNFNLCPPCSVYARLTKRFRSSTVRYEPNTNQKPDFSAKILGR